VYSLNPTAELRLHLDSCIEMIQLKEDTLEYLLTCEFEEQKQVGTNCCFRQDNQTKTTILPSPPETAFQL